MRIAALVVALVCGLSSHAPGSAAELWAFTPSLWYSAGPSGPADALEPRALTIELDPFSTHGAAYPYSQMYFQSASYDPSSSRLYVGGGGSDWSVQNKVYVYSGGPDGVELLSSSDAGMGDIGPERDWLGGIEYMNGSLYAVRYRSGLPGGSENIILRIDNPGTADQTVTQIGASLGSVYEIGMVRALCRDGQGGLYMMSGYYAPTTTLYRINTTTGSATGLHTFASGTFPGLIEGLAFSGGRLYGLTEGGSLYQIDLNTYDAILVGELGGSYGWEDITAIPEPGMLALAAVAAVAFLSRRRPRC